VTNLPFRSNEFDLITCFDVLSQLDPNDTLAAIAEVRGVLRHGGFLYIREPAYDWIRGSHDVAVATRHRYTLPELEEILTTAGFLIRHATYANSLLLGAAIAYRFATRFKSGDDSDLRRVPGWLNRILAATLRFEAGIVDRFRSPAGLSAIVLAEKG
jgi:SAM-dependent methyltransferase